MALIHRYFEPLHIQTLFHAPLMVQIEIWDPDIQRQVLIGEYPCTTTLSCGDIMELITAIEAQLQRSHTNLYAYHRGVTGIGLRPKR
ncbi:DUF1652 domain-containing protein [Pseudomonas argentinensis]|uniref:DUF1652 domain-containing protein n=1 Tax=Phytopseudomonas argentinensis TaxID=289370 RepID=UPI0009F249FD